MKTSAESYKQLRRAADLGRGYVAVHFFGYGDNAARLADSYATIREIWTGQFEPGLRIPRSLRYLFGGRVRT